MRKNIILSIILSMCVTAILTLTTTSCKRSKIEEPGIIPNAGFRIALSGTANPSTLYVPEALPAVPSTITVRALNSNGSPAANYQVIFQEGSYGYFDNYRNSIVKNTNASGIATAIFYLPPSVSVKASIMTNITVTLVDDGRLDNTLSAVEDIIPVHLIPYVIQGIIIHGHVLTASGNGVEGVTVTLDGAEGLADGVTVTRPSGSYEFYVAAGWYGSITPEADNYTFIPDSYEFIETAPIMKDLGNVDFIAVFGGGNTLTTDVILWDVPIIGGTQVVNVYNSTGDASIGYIVIPDANWIHVSPNSGSTPGSFTITIDENTTGEERTGTIAISATDTSVSNVNITINQQATEVPTDARLAVNIETLNLSGDAATVTINTYNSATSDTIEYIITTNPVNDWISVSELNGSTQDNFDITVTANSDGTNRTGQVILTPTTTGVSNTVTITVNQEIGPALAIDIASRNVPVGGETFNVTLTNPYTSDSITFELDNADSWIGWFNAPASNTGTTPTQVPLQVNPNSTGVLRKGVVTFKEVGNPDNQVTVTITQQGS